MSKPYIEITDDMDLPEAYGLSLINWLIEREGMEVYKAYLRSMVNDMARKQRLTDAIEAARDAGVTVTASMIKELGDLYND